jgi:sulfite dehydrogenase (quinone) subunit SoeC
MHPAYSVIFLTTLIGVGQGLFLALYSGEVYSTLELLPRQDGKAFYAAGSLLALAFLALGLLASFFHLGHPERAWRAAAQWRTSWLSREVIVLPAFMGLVLVYGALHYLGWNPPLVGTSELGRLTFGVGVIATVACLALFVCTAMIYASIRFLQEWHTPLTVINYTLLGMASGFTLATALAAHIAPAMTAFYGAWAVVLTLLALATRSASLLRNSRLKRKSTPQSAIGVRHARIAQKAQGFMGGSFNTREFFHGKPVAVVTSVRWLFLLLVFPVPVALLGAGLGTGHAGLLAAAFGAQYLGLIAERWFFFAQANHPQNLYYQAA